MLDAFLENANKNDMMETVPSADTVDLKKQAFFVGQIR